MCIYMFYYKAHHRALVANIVSCHFDIVVFDQQKPSVLRCYPFGPSLGPQPCGHWRPVNSQYINICIYIYIYIYIWLARFGYIVITLASPMVDPKAF